MIFPMMFALAAITAAQLAAPAQAPRSAVPTVATAQLSGTVRNAADDAPLARARVTAVSTAVPEPRVVLSGPDGTYVLGDLPPGSYTVTVTRTGYAPFTYGQGRSAAGTPLIVASGARRDAIDFALAAAGVIAGRILDEDGAPFAGATVNALVTHFENGRDLLLPVATAQTDDRGEFRLFGLAPGAYYVSASDPAFASVSTPKGVQHYSPTYFPGTTQPEQARTVPVNVGGATPAPRAEFRLQIVPPASVSGQIVPHDGRQLLSAAIEMYPQAGEGVPMEAPEDQQILPDGHFTFAGVAPGRYQILARGQTESAAPAIFASYSLDVRGNDITGIQMVLHPGAVLEGTVAIESARGTKPPLLSSLRVRAPFIDGSAFGEAMTGTVRTAGGYALRGIMKGEHQIRVDGLQPPWVVKSIEYRGRDITDLAIPVEEQSQMRDVRIVITDRASEVSGVVQNVRDRPVADTGVLVCSSVPVFWMQTSRRARVTVTDENGRWSVAGLPPGEYFAIASPTVSDGDLGHRGRLAALQTIATPFRIESNDARPTLTLQLSSAVQIPSVR